MLQRKPGGYKEKILAIFIAFVASFGCFILCFLVYFYVFRGIEDNRFLVFLCVTYLLVSVVFSWLARGEPFFSYTLVITSLAVVVSLIYIKKFSPLDKDPFSYQWLAPQDTLTLPLEVGDFGHILIRATVNDTSGSETIL